VLGIPVPYFSSTIPGFSGYGFTACPIVTAVAEYVQLIVLIGFFWKYKQLHLACWPDAGWSWAHITKPRVREYLNFYVPAALSIASDFWRVSVIGGIAANYGSIMLATFNTSYRILWMCLVISGSLGGATSIKMARTFGLGRPSQAKQSATVRASPPLCTFRARSTCTAPQGLPKFGLPVVASRCANDDPVHACPAIRAICVGTDWRSTGFFSDWGACCSGCDLSTQSRIHIHQRC
jgi:hypothetical protein